MLRALWSCHRKCNWMTCNLYTIRLKMVRSMIEPLITIYLFILDFTQIVNYILFTFQCCCWELSASMVSLFLTKRPKSLRSISSRFLLANVPKFDRSISSKFRFFWLPNPRPLIWESIVKKILFGLSNISGY